MANPTAPVGTFMPGTKVQVGNHRVIVEKYLSEGGFAHVYVVRLRQPVDGVETAVLKRVVVPDKLALANMRTEVETMKRLKGHRHIVTYIDSHASQLKAGGFEVFLLMEFCAGGGLIDFMNTRLQNRLTEPEILKIFGDVAEGVACMHYLKPPLLHRDLKVENVLIALRGSSSSSSYKICDFGSAAPPRPAATAASEGRLIEDDVQRHTTLQYRSPEMIDVYRKQPIDEKSDIWALGVFLYKLCYYTTPFEEVGQMAILNAQFKYPSYPSFSDKLKLLIASMLKEDPQKRPNIYEVLQETCHMRGKEVPIRDIYAGRSHSEARSHQQLPESPTETPKVGAIFSPPMQETQIIPEIAPMRRGRPTKADSSNQNSTKPSPSPRGSTDPFAALDAGNRRSEGGDELSTRFPTLNQFSLLHEKGDKFEFSDGNDTENKAATSEDITKRVTNALADQAFASMPPPKSPAAGARNQGRPDVSVEEKSSKPSPDLRAEPPQRQTPLHQPVPQKPSVVSTGTMTSPSPPPPPPRHSDKPSVSNRPIYRFPDPAQGGRPSSQPFEQDKDALATSRDNLPPRRSVSHDSRPAASAEDLPISPSSSRPSLEGQRPSVMDFDDPMTRSKSANAKSRPASAYVMSGPNKRLEHDGARSSFDTGPNRRQPDDRGFLRPVQQEAESDHDRANIYSDVGYLRAKEEEEQNRKREKRMSSGSKHVKRSSLSSLSFSGKALWGGRFGDAFRRFESNAPQERKSYSPSPDDNKARFQSIAGSAVTEQGGDGRDSDNHEDLTPEMRRERERRQMSQEEKRVANAAAEYRMRVAERGEGGARGGGGTGEATRSAPIHNKVQTLLQTQQKPTPPTVPTGYGRYTDTETTLQTKIEKPLPERTASDFSRKPQVARGQAFRPQVPPKDVPPTAARPPSSSVSHLAGRQAARPPPPPPKPKNLRTGNQPENSGTGDDQPRFSIDKEQPPTPKDDWESNFHRRYPSLSGLELVETEIGLPKAPVARAKEV